MWILTLIACGPPIPRDLLEDHATKFLALGHPRATFEDVELEGWSKGEPSQGERWADVRIAYLRPGRFEPNSLLVRVKQESEEPCKIRLDVLNDDGPEPFLLDNGIASAALGNALCDDVVARAR